MKTIKFIIFGVLVLLAFTSGTWLLCCMSAVEIHDMWAFLKSFVLSALVLGGSSVSIKFLWERWYK